MSYLYVFITNSQEKNRILTSEKDAVIYSFEHPEYRVEIYSIIRDNDNIRYEYTFNYYKYGQLIKNN